VPALPEEEVEASVRSFLLRMRSRGAPGLTRLGRTFRAAASAEGTLGEAGFSDVALREGLCSGQRDCTCVYSHFARLGNGTVHVDALMQAAHGTLDDRRLEAVREVWRQFDPDGTGSCPVAELAARFDARRLPCVCYDGVDAQIARRDFFVGIGASDAGEVERAKTLTLQEVLARRRPPPIGTWAHEGPLLAPAGKPTGQRGIVVRSFADFSRELDARPWLVHPDACVTAQDFEDYYAAVSLGIPDDVLFLQTLRDPWSGHEAHELSQMTRDPFAGTARAGPNPAAIKVCVTLQDGSKRIATLRDDRGLCECAGRAGLHQGQIFAWGKEVHAEVIRRLEADGMTGIRRVRICP